jgi:integrase
MLVENWSKRNIRVRRIKGKVRVSYNVDGTLPNGKRLRQRFNNQFDAEEFAEEWRNIGINMRSSVRERVTFLSPDQERDALVALEILKEKFGEEKWTLKKAVAWIVANYTAQAWEDTHVEVAVKDFIDWKEEAGTKTNYLKKLRGAFGFIKDKDGKELIRPGSFVGLDKLLNDITVDDLKHLILGKQWEVSDSTRRDLWKTLNHFYEWASGVLPYRCSENPMKHVVKKKANELDPEAFSPEQAQKLMDAAHRCFDSTTVPYFAIALFAGLRPEEIRGNEDQPILDWNQFNWDEGSESIRLKGKKAWRRVVQLPANCVAWLKPYKLDSGPVIPENFNKKYDVVRAVAGFKTSKARLYGIDKSGLEEELKGSDSPDRPEWIRDGLRHSALSYRLRDVQDTARVCLWAGNSPKVFNAHYEGLVTDADAKRYWAITPPSNDGGSDESN